MKPCPKCDRAPPDCSVMPFLLSTRTEAAAYALASYWHQLQDRCGERAREDGAEVFHQLQKLGVPADVLLALRRKHADTTCLDAARKFGRVPVEKAGPIVTFLLLIGARGIGKSVAAGWVLFEHARKLDWHGMPSGPKSEPCIWIQARTVTTHESFGAVEEEWLERLRCTRLLVLDDLGDETTERGLAALKGLILHRYEHRRRTVMTSNLRAPAFRQRYSDALVDRLNTVAIVPDLSKSKNLRGIG